MGSQGRITLMPSLLSVEGLTMDPKDLGLDLFYIDYEGRDVDIDSEDNSRLSAGDDSRYDEEFESRLSLSPFSFQDV
jgi:hypothetical protein